MSFFSLSVHTHKLQLNWVLRKQCIIYVTLYTNNTHARGSPMSWHSLLNNWWRSIAIFLPGIVVRLIALQCVINNFITLLQAQHKYTQNITQRNNHFVRNFWSNKWMPVSGNSIFWIHTLTLYPLDSFVLNTWYLFWCCAFYVQICCCFNCNYC